MRFKRLEKKRSSRTHGLKRLYKVGLFARVESSDKESLGEEDPSKKERNIADIDANKEISIVDETVEDQGRIEETVSTAALITTADVTPDELTMAQALIEINKLKPKTDKGATTTITTANTIPTPASTRPKAKGVVMQEPSETTSTTTTIPIPSKDKGKGIMERERARLAGMKAQQEKEANIALIEKWHDVQAKIKADYELAQRLQAEEQE
nr:hypothetical protein [Tanacetum cinerariifolium]